MRKRRSVRALILILAVLMMAAALSGCGSTGGGGAEETERVQSAENEAPAGSGNSAANEAPAGSSDNTRAGGLLLEVNGKTLEVETENNPAADALKELAGPDGLELKLEEYGGFEKVGPLPESLPASDEQMDVSAGDLVLYQGDQISLLYGENAWSYTRLGRVKGISGDDLARLLGSGDVKIRLKIGE